MKRKHQASSSSLQEEPPFKKRRLNKSILNPAYGQPRCTTNTHGHRMILESTKKILARDSTQALLGVLLLLLAVHRANLGEESDPINPATLSNYTIEDVIKFNEALDAKEIWAEVFRGADNMSAVSSIVAAVMSCLSLIWKGRSMKRFSVITMMVLVSTTMLATLISDVASWMVGYRFKMLSTPCAIILMTLLYALNIMRRANELDGDVVSFSDTDLGKNPIYIGDVKNPILDDHSACPSCLSLKPKQQDTALNAAKEQDAGVNAVKVEM